MEPPNDQPPKIRDTGLTVLFDKTTPGNQNVEYVCPPPAIVHATDALCSFVFVHGLNGHPKNTWTHGNGFFWPWELRKEFTKARVMTFGYNAGMGSELTENFIRIKGIASTLNGALANKRIKAEVSMTPKL